MIRTAFTLALGLVAASSALGIELEAERLDGRTMRGELVSVSPDLTLRTSDGDQALEWSELLSVRPLHSAAATQPAAAPVAGVQFTLADQSVFRGRVSEAGPAEFVVELTDGQKCRVNPSMMRSIIAEGVDASARARVDELLRASDASSDAAVIARGGEALTLRGSVKHIDAQRVLFHWNERDVPIPWPSVVGLVFARPAERSASSIVRTRDGEAFAGRVIEGTAEQLTLQSAAFERLTLTWERVERIDCRSRKLIFLSELTPARYDFEPFFDLMWRFAADRTLSGRPIRLGGRDFARGLTLHSKSMLTYRLAGEYAQFAATAGICDEVGQRGAVMLRVLGDERVLWEGRTRGGEPPVEVLVDVTNVNELALQVDYDEALDLGDHACWAFARLIR